MADRFKAIRLYLWCVLVLVRSAFTHPTMYTVIDLDTGEVRHLTREEYHRG